MWMVCFVSLACAEPSPLDTGHSTIDTASWRVWFEAKAMHAPVTMGIAASERTEWAAGRLVNDQLEYFSKAQFAALGIEPERFLAAAQANATADLETLKPRYERDRKKVIQFAELASQRPIVASATLAPKLLDIFKNTLGEKVLLVVPSRFVAYVFPALASNYRDYGPMIREAFSASAWPVSVEIFEVSAGGMKAVGVYEEP